MLVVCLLSSLSVIAQLMVQTSPSRPVNLLPINGGGGGGDDPTPKPTVKPTTPCSARFTCKTCAAADGKCVWDLKTGCISSQDYICFEPCVRQAAQCPACSTLTAQGCGVCTNKGCFWNTGTGACQEVKCSSCKKNGDCVPPGCSQNKACGSCIGAVDTLTQTPCQWNANTKQCNAGCIHQPDVPTTCIAKGGTCPAISTIAPVVVSGTLSGRLSTVPPVFTISCPARASCSACTSDNKCLWDPSRGGCVDGADTCFGSQFCARTPAQCPMCSAPVGSCAVCTLRGCFWNPSTSTCVAEKTSVTKKYGDCIPAGCTQYTSCSTCLAGSVPDSNPSTTCTWNAHSNSCYGGCIHDPDVPYKCLKAPQTCPVTTVKPVILGPTGISIATTAKPKPVILGPTGITIATTAKPKPVISGPTGITSATTAKPRPVIFGPTGITSATTAKPKPVIFGPTGITSATTAKPATPVVLGPTGITRLATAGPLGTVAPLRLTCSARTSCKTCTNDGNCAWNPSVGCVSSNDYCFNPYCARSPAQCQVCSTFSNCGTCTDRGCFWNPSTSTCVDSKTATTKKYGDCIPAGCSQYSTCQTCLPATAPLANPATTCTWNAHSKKCEAGCFHEPDAPYSCFKAPQTCPA